MDSVEPCGYSALIHLTSRAVNSSIEFWVPAHPIQNLRQGLELVGRELEQARRWPLEDFLRLSGERRTCRRWPPQA